MCTEELTLSKTKNKTVNKQNNHASSKLGLWQEKNLSMSSSLNKTLECTIAIQNTPFLDVSLTLDFKSLGVSKNFTIDLQINTCL